MMRWQNMQKKLNLLYGIRIVNLLHVCRLLSTFHSSLTLLTRIISFPTFFYFPLFPFLAPERPIRPRSGVSRSNSQEEKLWKYSLWRAFCSYPIPVEELVLPTTSTTSTFFSLFSRKVSEAKAFTQIRTPLTSLSFSNSIPLNSSHQAGVDLLSFISSSSLDPSKVSPSNSNGSLELNVKQFDDESRFEESILVDVTEEQGAEDDELESSLRLLPNNILRSDNS